ncbi:hypothetical protein H5410_039598 [Solanum commersonii]|uniref:Uncharacterized protein n=1 Tax=Solanum commersonii TaxID=4109 RepID=A0A9J5XP15_SOLCO|nr:hypothetical protein H5410_039598 [Solanum commersonii]
MSCNQPNKHRIKEQTLKEPHSLTSKAQHPTLVRQQNVIPRVIYISAQHLTHVRNNKISLLKLLQRKVSIHFMRK